MKKKMRKNVLISKIFVRKLFNMVRKRYFVGQLATKNRINNNFEEVINAIA